MKQSLEAKNHWTRKTFGQKVTPRSEDLDKLARINTVLVKLWNMAVEQCNTWLGMPKQSAGTAIHHSHKSELLAYPREKQ